MSPDIGVDESSPSGIPLTRILKERRAQEGESQLFLCFLKFYWYSCPWIPVMWKGIHVSNIAMEIANQQKYSNIDDIGYII